MTFQALPCIPGEHWIQYPYAVMEADTEIEQISLYGAGDGDVFDLFETPKWDSESGLVMYQAFFAFLKEEGKVKAVRVSRLEDFGEYYSFLQKLGFEEIDHDLSEWYPTIDLGLELS